MADGEWLTSEDAARLAGVNLQTLMRAALQRGEIPYKADVGRRWLIKYERNMRFRAADVEAWMRSGSQAGES